MMFTSYAPVYDADFSAKSEYSNEDWNQVKGIQDGTSPGFINTLIFVLKNFRQYELEQKRLENEQKNKNKIEKQSEEVEEAEFKYNIQTQNNINLFTKLDIGFPSIDKSLNQKIEKIEKIDNDNNWKVVNNKKKIEPLFIDKKKLDAKVKKSQMCNSVKNGIISVCPHGKSCRFAHTVEELTPLMCQHSKLCKFVELNGDCYCNIGDKICFYQHVDEKIEDYLIRVGLKKRGPVTEDEMQHAFDDFLKPVIEVDKKPLFVKNTFKKFENVQNKSTEKIFVSEKNTKFISKNLEQLKIEKRNEINIKIRDIKLSIKRNSDTVIRFREMKDRTEFYNKQILKLEDDIKNKKSELKILEEKLKDVDSMKVKDNLDIKTVKINSTPEVVEKVVEKEEVTVYLYQPKESIKSDTQSDQIIEQPIKEDCVLENDWIEVKQKTSSSKSIQNVANDRNIAFDILKNSEKINSTRIKTKMCFKGENCKHKGCTFAHNEKELKISNCIFGKNCKFVKKQSGILINKCKTQICKHKHEDENMTEFYLRIDSKNYKLK
jgi:hypothetical protein